eukprot:gene5911-9741_t
MYNKTKQSLPNYGIIIITLLSIITLAIGFVISTVLLFNFMTSAWIIILAIWCFVLILSNTERIIRIFVFQKTFDDFESAEMINLMTEEEEKLLPKKQMFIFKVIRFFTSHIIILPVFLSSIVLIINLNYFAFAVTFLASIFYLLVHLVILSQDVIDYTPKRYGWMIIASVFLFPFFLLTLLITVQSFTETFNHYLVLPPGKMVDVGTHKMHLNCKGTGSPTVLFIHGYMGLSLDWSLMHEKISETTKACTFDRSGYGWSEFGPLPRDGNQFSKEVNAMLKSENISNSDLIIVAHSLGGALTRAYYPSNKDNIKGVFFVDALDVNDPKMFPYQEGEQFPVPFYGYAAGIFSGMGFNFLARSVVEPYDRSEETMNLVHQKNYGRSDFVKSSILEAEDFPSLFAQANKTHSFGDIPLIAYGAGQGLIKSFGWNATKLSRLSSNGQSYHIEDSPHGMQFIQKYATLFNIHVIQMVFMVRNKN